MEAGEKDNGIDRRCSGLQISVFSLILKYQGKLAKGADHLRGEWPGRPSEPLPS